MTIRKQKQFKPLEDERDCLKKWHYILQKVLRTDDVTDFAYTPHPLTDDNVCKKFATNIYCIKSTAAQEKPSKYGRSSCGEYTTNDMEGPFFEVGV